MNYDSINKLISLNNLYKLFLLAAIIILLKSEPKSILVSILLFFIIIYIYIDTQKIHECMSITNNELYELITEIHNDNLRYNYNYNIIRVGKLTEYITKLALKDLKLKKIIKLKNIEIYGEVLCNIELKNYLLFNNLIHEDGIPLFINESESVILSNQIKILLIVMPQSLFDSIILS
jgi:hypothetical protein